jgi:transposase
LIRGSARVSVVARTGQLSDEAWTLIEPHLPSSAGCRGGQWRDHRQVLEAILWRYRTGSPWRDLPPEFGPWQTVWKRLNRWAGDGTLDNLLAAAHGDAEVAAELEWVVSVDSTIARAHQHAAGARKIDAANSETPTEDTGGRTELQGSTAGGVRRAG